jgi:hypothetical protein
MQDTDSQMTLTSKIQYPRHTCQMDAYMADHMDAHMADHMDAHMADHMDAHGSSTKKLEGGLCTDLCASFKYAPKSHSALH